MKKKEIGFHINRRTKTLMYPHLRKILSRNVSEISGQTETEEMIKKSQNDVQ